MRYRFYTTSQKAWEGMLSAIGSAKETIYLEMYIFHDDTHGFDFLSELERKAGEGIRVFIILDALGSYGLPSFQVDRLRNAGCEVLFFSYWFRRMHRKILVVDERIAFLGGVNISHQFALWNDLHVHVTGRIVKHVAKSFVRIYHECGGKDPLLSQNTKPKLIKKAGLWFFEHGLKRKRTTLKKLYEEHICDAKKSVILITPYLIPRHWLISALHHALLRGAKVEIIVPTKTDFALGDRINRYYLSLFQKLGAECYLSPNMNHAKVMLIDDRLATIGSQNLDAQSFEWNVEAGIFFEDQHMVKDLKVIIEEWKNEAVSSGEHVASVHWYDVLLGFFLGVFNSVL